MLLGATLLAAPVSAEVLTGEDPETGLRSWTWSHAGTSVQLLQLLPDQIRAFFLARGFEGEEVERIARACVFQTIFRNDGDRPVEYDLEDWSLLNRGERRPLRTRERWDAEWQTHPIDEPARIALRWALLPTVQGFEPGDYNWGMTSFGLPPGEPLDLRIVVRIAGEQITAQIPSVVCAADR
jgi:hypothetical protein